MDHKDRLEAARARKAAAEAALSEADALEIEQRAEVERIEEDARALETKKRDLSLTQRLELAREAMPEAKLRGVAIQEFPDTFVVRYKPAAHSAFLGSQRQAQMADQQGKRGDWVTGRRQYALATVVDWNGRSNYNGTDSQLTDDLRKYLTEHEGLVTAITNVAAELAGIVAEERKSGT
jgi:hypothetical protein